MTTRSVKSTLLRVRQASHFGLVLCFAAVGGCNSRDGNQSMENMTNAMSAPLPSGRTNQLDRISLDALKLVKPFFVNADYRIHATQFLGEVSQKLNAEDLRGLEASIAHTNNGLRVPIPLTTLPARILELQPQQPFTANFDPGSESELAHLNILWGGPKYMYGIIVGGKEFCPAPVNNELVIRWKEGIYIFHSSN